MNAKINLNPGVRTIYSKTLNDIRGDIIKDGVSFNDAEAMANYGREYEAKESATAQQKNLAQFLGTIAEAAAGRGVNKTTYGPAHARGYHLNNPHYFGMENKTPVPYDKMLADARNLRAVMNGFQEVRSAGGSIPDDAAYVLSQLKHKEGLLASAFNKKQNHSIYMGVPKDAARNLFEINAKNRRENNLYAFY